MALRAPARTLLKGPGLSTARSNRVSVTNYFRVRARADLGFATNLSRADVSMELSQVFTHDILDWLETDDLTVPTVVARRLQAPPTLY